MEDSGIDSDSKPTTSGTASTVSQNDQFSNKNKDTESCKSDLDQENTALMNDSPPPEVVYHGVNLANKDLPKSSSRLMPTSLLQKRLEKQIQKTRRMREHEQNLEGLPKKLIPRNRLKVPRGQTPVVTKTDSHPLVSWDSDRCNLDMESGNNISCSDSVDLRLFQKRVRNEELYYRNVRKKARIEGKSYKNSTGRIVPARVTGNDCRCRRKCFELFDDDSKLEILNIFSTFKTKDEQDLYLQCLLTIESIKQKRPRKDEPKSRSSNFGYFIRDGSNHIRVCKKAFISLHGITEKRIRRIASLLQAGAIPEDKRGRFVSVNATPEDICA